MCYSCRMRIHTSLFFLFVASAHAADGVTAAVTAAREKLQKRERVAAAKLLRNFINESKAGEGKKKALEELRQVATVFFTNEGQRNFQLAESVRLSGQTGYQSKYEEALKVEGQNSSVLLAEALGLLSMKKCKQAAALVERSLETNPYAQEAQLLLYKAKLCDGQNVEDQMLSITDKELLPIWKATQAQKALAEGRGVQATSYAREAIHLDKAYPAGYFWVWSANSGEGEEGIEEAQKFLSLCKGVTPALRRKYYWDADLCAKTETVEEAVKKAENQSP